MDIELQQLEHRLDSIEARNRRVEADKAWETSLLRKFVILILTYVVIVLFLHSVDISRPWINAIVPSIGFFLSTLTLPFVKSRWIKKYLQNNNQ